MSIIGKFPNLPILIPDKRLFRVQTQLVMKPARDFPLKALEQAHATAHISPLWLEYGLLSADADGSKSVSSLSAKV